MSPDFVRFWDAYPRKVDKPRAVRAWEKLGLENCSVESVMAGLQAAKFCEQWVRDGGRFIPHPATWLNGRRWEDEQAVTTKGAFPL